MNSARPDIRPDTRQHILDCGQQLIAAKGFVGVGLAEILGSAKVPKGSFYHYFASKEAFGLALLDSYFSRYECRVATLNAHSDLNGAQRLLTYFERWIETQQGQDAAQHCLIVKLSAEISDLSEAMRTRMHGATDTLLRQLASHVAEGQADGSIRNQQAPAELAEWLYQAWLGASLLTKLRRDGSAFASALNNTRKILDLP